jgi:hypothetical protein
MVRPVFCRDAGGLPCFSDAGATQIAVGKKINKRTDGPLRIFLGLLFQRRHSASKAHNSELCVGSGSAKAGLLSGAREPIAIPIIPQFEPVPLRF